MAVHSKCPKCDGKNFEMVEETPKGSAFRLMFIRCAECGAVVGVMDYFNIGDLMRKVLNKLGL
jgi:uncharacterized Zn finger protein